MHDRGSYQSRVRPPVGIGRLVLGSFLAVILAGLFLLAPAFGRTPAASAQGIVTCPNGQIVAPGIPCPSTGQTPCPGSGIVVPAGAPCPVVCPGGQLVSTPDQCGAAGTAGGLVLCPGGAQVTAGQACPGGQYVTCQGSGVVALAGVQCPTVCPGGGLVPAGQPCPGSGTQLQNLPCPNTGVNVQVSTPCPIVCPGGQVVPANQPCPGSTVVPQIVTCPGTGVQVAYNLQSQCPVACSNGQIVAPGQTCPPGSTPVTATTLSVCQGGYSCATSSPPAPPAQALLSPNVNYPAGWNLVAGGTVATITGVTSPLYTFQPGDTGYESLAPGSLPKPGLGYWVYLTSPISAALSAQGPGSFSMLIPPRQWVMIGNPGRTTATVTGADSVLVFSTATATYTQSNQLAPGQGAWVGSAGGGTVTVTNAPS
jgi:hypothetical protein